MEIQEAWPWDAAVVGRGPWALTVMKIVGDHVAVLIVGSSGGGRGFKWWLCGDGEAGWARAPSPDTPTPRICPHPTDLLF